MPLSGLKVLDLSRVVSGPFCTMLLADLGADVVKVEAPDGDPSRVTGIMGACENPYFVNLNRNKRTITIDMKPERGKQIVRRMAKGSDVLVENFRPGVMDRLGLGYAALSAVNPGLIYAAVTGFGKTGPYKDRPAFDFIAQAMSGFMSLNGDRSMPYLRVGIPISDTIAGLYAAFGILAALRVREQTGRGQEIQTAMVDGLISMFTFASGAYFSTGDLPPRNGNDHMVVSPYGLFNASDGPIAIAPSTERNWQQLCAALKLEHLMSDPRFDSADKRRAHRPEINAIVENVIQCRTREEWITLLNQAGVPCGPVNNLAQTFADPQVLHQEMVIESAQPSGPVKMPGFALKLSQTPARLRKPSPQVGEHSLEVLRELGYHEEEIQSLIRDRVVAGRAIPEGAPAEPACTSTFKGA
ncbi:MAG: CoA transferase [Desulfobacterales bacterium]|jgi:crotonobetainyl-CoA:carnitine CoA-transferase CaiB-like acyl-CoA transferase|nr:CoA transferase [Desulfobacterales bacterium]